MDLVDKLFVEIFDTVNKEYKKHLKTVDQQYPFRLLKISDEVITQGRRIHDPELFIESLTKRCIDINKEIMSRYIDYLSIHP
ncbi:hypothetical protein WN944_019227 [Citrus x changshan-huyou]|uniref:Uncharacterized protein n=1 Tax=Citrus x changshan-huyou TaxID=2935761 RepID=A0AAP0LVJ9_9ROSI